MLGPTNVSFSLNNADLMHIFHVEQYVRELLLLFRATFHAQGWDDRRGTSSLIALE